MGACVFHDKSGAPNRRPDSRVEGGREAIPFFLASTIGFA